ncbi:OmpH family outer membrane protein [Tabrizicola sp.]|uniref:OmpH family outer membrane protein n=1 Tax=Tabrizicola sp. TaxID=2005166 RepID=UPI003D291221
MRLAAGFVGLVLAAALGLAGQIARAQEAAGSAPDQGGNPAPPVVFASILTLDDERFFADSVFGKSVIARQERDSRALIDENRRIEAALEAEEKDLTIRRTTLSREEFAPLAEAFNEKVEGIRKAQDAKTRDLQRGFDADRQRFLEAARPVLAEVMGARGAVAIIDSRAVFVGFDNIDVTDEAIARLDAAVAEGRLAPVAP